MTEHSKDAFAIQNKMSINRIVSLLFITPNLQASPSTLSSRPNILWILADDLGWGELEVFSRIKNKYIAEKPIS